jgi:hypothetical protein
MIRSNASQVIKVLIKNIEGVQADQVSRACAAAVLPEMKERIHVQGKDSNGAQIGTYSNAYMKVRTGNFTNADRFSKGAKKGENKNAGVFTDATIRLNKKTGVFTGEEKVGTARPKFNRTADTKVVLSLTRQMENDMSVVAAGKSYGIGFKNSLNYDKSIWCEETYKKPIYQLTKEEAELARKTAVAFIDQIKGKS